MLKSTIGINVTCTLSKMKHYHDNRGWPETLTKSPQTAPNPYRFGSPPLAPRAPLSLQATPTSQSESLTTVGLSLQHLCSCPACVKYEGPASGGTEAGGPSSLLPVVSLPCVSISAHICTSDCLLSVEKPTPPVVAELFELKTICGVHRRTPACARAHARTCMQWWVLSERVSAFCVPASKSRL